jgi:hypothetical protein
LKIFLRTSQAQATTIIATLARAARVAMKEESKIEGNRASDLGKNIQV